MTKPLVAYMSHFLFIAAKYHLVQNISNVYHSMNLYKIIYIYIYVFFIFFIFMQAIKFNTVSGSTLARATC